MLCIEIDLHAQVTDLYITYESSAYTVSEIGVFKNMKLLKSNFPLDNFFKPVDNFFLKIFTILLTHIISTSSIFIDFNMQRMGQYTYT